MNKFLKKALSIAIAGLMLFGIADLSVFPEFDFGIKASAADVMEISTAENLVEFRDKVNKGETDLDAVLTADIDLSKVCGKDIGNWTPIGDYNNNVYYNGKFDGGGHTINNLYIDAESTDYQGLFGCIAPNAEIKNLSVDGDIKGNSHVGGICGSSENATITNCLNKGNISGNDFGCGGICGENDSGTIKNCSNTGTVFGSNNVGGICGYNGRSSTIKNCTIENCTNVGTISGQNYAGGICGYNRRSSTIENCYYLDTCGAGGDGTSTAAEDFANGTVCGLVGYHAYIDDRCCLCKSEPPEQIDGVYQIANCYNLVWFRNEVNKGNNGINAVLVDDIDLSEVCGEDIGNWTPIGNFSKKYTGEFDGDGHTIKNLYIDDEDGSYKGLFGYLYYYAEIKNLSVDGYVKGLGNVGGICGYNCHGTIENCLNSCSISGYNAVGGICGNNYKGGTITSCSNAGGISGENGIGGICGGNYSDTNNISAIKNCLNTGCVSGHESIGGICGDVGGGTIENCSNKIDIYGTSLRVGGICGDVGLEATITGCLNTGNIRNSNNDNAENVQYYGGICGQNVDCTIENCSNTGNISGIGKYFGGICGYSRMGTIKSCSNTGNISGGEGIGGICGDQFACTITNCYYLKTCGAGGINDKEVENCAESKDDGQYRSGEVCYLLNGGVTDGTQAWYQSLGTNQTPHLMSNGDDTVYENQYENCVGTYYSNTPVVESRDHKDANDNGICDTCGKIISADGVGFKGCTLSLNGNIGVNFYMALGENVIENKDDYKMHFTLPNGKEIDVAVPDPTEKDGTDYYVFSCNVAAKEMTGKITAQMMKGNKTVGKSYEYSVKSLFSIFSKREKSGIME